MNLWKYHFKSFTIDEFESDWDLLNLLLTNVD